MAKYIWCPHCRKPAVQYINHMNSSCGTENMEKSTKPHIHAMCNACSKDWILKDTITEFQTNKGNT